MIRLLYAVVLACSLLPSAFAGKPVNYYELPRKKLLELAEEGDREAIWQLQRPSYFDPRKKQNVTRTLEERLPWMRKGAKLGDYRMQFNLAHHLLLRQAAERGHLPSMEGMAAELSGRNRAAARKWLRRAAEAGSADGRAAARAAG